MHLSKSAKSYATLLCVAVVCVQWWQQQKLGALTMQVAELRGELRAARHRCENAPPPRPAAVAHHGGNLARTHEHEKAAGNDAPGAGAAPQDTSSTSVNPAMEPGHEIAPEFKAQCAAIMEGKTASFGQAYQDWWLYHNVFKHGTPSKHRTYLDLGANHPFHISNSLFFEKCLGWQGICVEPNPFYAPMFLKRTCTHVKSCLWNTTKVLKFDISGGEFGGIVDPLINNHAKRKAAQRFQCRPLEAILHEQHISAAGFASLDIEGAEMVVLSSFDFSKFDIQAWVVETNKLSLADQKALDLIFMRQGYSKVDGTLCCRNSPAQVKRTGWSGSGNWLDDIYVKRERALVYPEVHSRVCTKEEKQWAGSWCELGMPTNPIP